MGYEALWKGCSWAETVRVLKEVVARYGQRRIEWEMKAHLVLSIPRIADEAGGRPCRHHFREAASSKSPVGVLSTSTSANEVIVRVRNRSSSRLSNTYGLLTVSTA